MQGVQGVRGEGGGGGRGGSHRAGKGGGFVTKFGGRGGQGGRRPDPGFGRKPRRIMARVQRPCIGLRSQGRVCPFACFK